MCYHIPAVWGADNCGRQLRTGQLRTRTSAHQDNGATTVEGWVKTPLSMGSGQPGTRPVAHSRGVYGAAPLTVALLSEVHICPGFH
ncbi:unnamed protein product [Cyprideis torosa]|uniref:Uncharacterized protein n=1 Tax=Cyprideis torosa TaxID=163714 RepID=A0A7R8W351_9CRUS|nr:unnamed protein product [Cyprideis torosa]CAG0881771.1 unnamed protein product [Cyprideis torosa]